MPVFRLSLPGATLSPAIIPSHRSSKFPTSEPVFASGFRSPSKRVSESPLVLGNRCGSLWAVRCGMAGERSDDELYMRRCVEIARKAIGFTSPNPMVGCVIVKDGNVVGQGFHPKAGQPHAEVFALRDAGDLAENATAYVSLEPCNHYGRTPPCTEALIKAKVKRVVVGMVDPNPIVASKGVDKLRNAGIEVTVGVEEEMCKSLNESYIHQMLTGKPLVALRYSLSVNGQIVDQLGEGAADLGGYYSRLLQEYDAVIVSSASIVDNFPVPLSKEPGANQPFLIISASNGNSPIEVPDLPAEAASRSIIFGDKESIVGPISAEKGIEMVIQDKKSLGAILEYAKRRGFCSILIDLRVCTDDAIELLREGFDQNLLRKAVVEVLPVWVESDSEKSLVMFKSLAKTIDMKKLEPKISGKSVLLEGYF